MSHQCITWPEPWIINWVVANPSSYKVEPAQPCTSCSESVAVKIRPKKAQKAWVSYMSSGPNAQGPIPLYSLLSPSLHLWPRRELPVNSGQRKRELRPGFQKALPNRQPPCESRWLSTLLRELSKDSNKRESFQWSELQAVHLVVSSFWKEKKAGMWLYTDAWDVVNGLVGWSEDDDCKNVGKEIWVRATWIAAIPGWDKQHEDT